jgi:hypothetical protein
MYRIKNNISIMYNKMSVAILDGPNLKTIYCGQLNANSLNFNSANVSTLNVDNINENTSGHGVVLQGNINVSNGGVITFPQVASEGIKLPTFGGTPALLNSYEILSIPTTMGGIFTPPVATTINLVRIGSVVNLTIVAATSSGVPGGNNTITFTNNIPTRFAPTATTACQIVLYDNSAYAAGQLFITASGVVTAQLLTGANFPGMDDSGFNNNTSVSYSLL